MHRASARSTIGWMLAGLAAATGGCGGVSTTSPLAESTADELRPLLSGAWAVRGGSVQIRFDSKGVGQFAGLRWDDEEERFEMMEGQLRAVKAGRRGFLSVRLRSSDGTWPKNHSLMEYAILERDDLLVWSPDEHVFARAVESDELAGKVGQRNAVVNVTLTGAPEAILEYLTGKGRDDLFEYRSPLVFHRIYPTPANASQDHDTDERADK